MERATILTSLRGDAKSATEKEHDKLLFAKDGSVIGNLEVAAISRFPKIFRQSVPENAQVSTKFNC